MARPTNLEEYREAQLAMIECEFSNLVEDDLGLKEKFLNLACETAAALPESHWGKWNRYRPYADSALNLACGEINETRQLLPTSLQEQWLAWRADYERLISRNPRLDLADRMQDMSEHNDASSWPYGYEDDIQDWVDSGERNNPPFRAQSDFPSPEFFHHLQELRSIIQGWLFWSEAQKRVVYVDESQWLKIKKEKRLRKQRAKEMSGLWLK